MTSVNPYRSLACAVALSLLWGSFTPAAWGKKKDPKESEYAVTEAELQADLMSYADRYAAISAQAVDDVNQLEPAPGVRYRVNSDHTYSSAAAFTIAADPNPQVALLDMVVMATLGRMIFEDDWRTRYGAIVDPMVIALGKLEKDVWEIADGILDGTQQAELRQRIEAFRSDNPELTTFSHLRFADFPSKRATSSLKATSSGGIFKSVRKITEQVEQTRMLAERGVYMSTRLPLLGGNFADVWLSQLSMNPAVDEILGNVHTFAEVSDRLATVAETLPALIAEERNETIRQLVLEVTALRADTVDHVFESFAAERNSTIEQFAAEEEKMRGVLTELRQTLEAANDLTVSADTLVAKLDLGAPTGDDSSAEPAKPFDIDDYRATLVEAGAAIRELDNLLGSAQRLLDSPGGSQLLPQLLGSIDDVGDESVKIVDRVFLLALLLIVVTMASFVLARLVYRWLANRMAL
jgi:hypothetical protein